MNDNMHKEVALGVMKVFSPLLGDVTITTLTNLDKFSSIAMHLVTIVCTIAVAVYTIKRKKK